MTQARRVALLMTHPTQYHAPWFRALAQRPEMSIHVYYGFQPSPDLQGKDFGVRFEWDAPLLDGYPNSFLENIAEPGWGYRSLDTPGIRDIIAREPFDCWVINGWSTKSEWQAIRACWKRRLPMMIRGDSTLLDRRPLPTRIAKRLLLGRWLPRFERYLTVGKLNEDYYEHYGADRSRFFPVRHFVDNDWFARKAGEARADRARLRKSMGIPADATVFLFAGKLMHKKQPAAAVEAMKHLRRDSGAHLLVVGDGAMRGQCESIATAAGLPVTFAGFFNQSRMPEAYAAADVLLLPSAYDETWGLVVNEAMASGLPAIVSDKVGCAPDLIATGETGAVFPAGNVPELAMQMEKYLSTRSEASRQGQNAALRIQRYSLDQAVENTVNAVLSVNDI